MALRIKLGSLRKDKKIYHQDAKDTKISPRKMPGNFILGGPWRSWRLGGGINLLRWIWSY
jgi:hypothetical protein